MPVPEKQSSAQLQPRGLPLYLRAVFWIEDVIDSINWIHIAFKCCAYTYIAFIAWITWHVLPFNGHWDIVRDSDRVPPNFQDLTNYFGTFQGSPDCKINALELYSSPHQDEYGSYANDAFCLNRQMLLQSMSNGGRIGFDAPYMPQGCHYRWYSTAEICMILERFASLVFVGDSNLQHIYNAFNILLRQDLANGALQTWAMTSEEKRDCKCENQFTRTDCAKHFVTASSQVNKNVKYNNGEIGNRFYCDRASHTFLQISADKSPQSVVDTFNQLIPKSPRSNYKPIPIIHSLAPMTASHQQATASLLDFMKLADLSERKTPMLWIGPTAAGHIEIRGRKTNQEIWDFDRTVANVADENNIDILKMWNMTVQASSWDGIRFGERVALVQAMMVINWLSRLESS